MYKENAEKLLDFIGRSPSTFHVIKNMKDVLLEAGFEELREDEKWSLEYGKKYFVTRNGSSIAAFKIPAGGFKSFNIMAGHSDSPSFKIKENPEISVEKKYTKLNVEGYGGMLCAPWLDRPLSVAGRVAVRDGNKVRTVLVDVDRDLLLIPNLAIHMNRTANDGTKYNAQTDMLPLFSCGADEGRFMDIVAEAAGVKPEQIIGNDLYLYNRVKGSIWGADEEFISSGKLDDLECAFSSFEGFLAGENETNVTVHCVFDNEEVGSGTKQGADSTFLNDTLVRICSSFGKTDEDYRVAIASSFMVSGDNAHAMHPNHTDKTDPVNRPVLNGGVIIKHSANQKYTTDAVSCAIMKMICDKAGVPSQVFHNRSDMAGGSTLGNISNSQVSLNTVDIGVVQLAMHSPYETAGIRDVTYLMKTAETFFSSVITPCGNGTYEVK